MIIRRKHIKPVWLEKIEIKKEFRAKGRPFSSHCPNEFIKDKYKDIMSKEFSGCAKQNYKRDIYYDDCHSCWAYFLDHYIEKKSNTEGFIDV